MTSSRLLILTVFVAVWLLEHTNATLRLPCSPSVSCGRPAVEPDRLRIVGGYASERGAWPWMVYLLEGNYIVCGGAIISDRFILTAAHCFTENRAATSKWKAVAGEVRLDHQDSQSQQSVGANSIIIHEDFNATTLENDIALLMLSQPLTFSGFVRPICVPDEDQVVYTGQLCYMAGWGDTRGTGDMYALNQVAVPIIADDVCSTPQWYGADFFPKKTFCAGYEEGGKDACHGDSGGPLICKDGKKWFVQGISSWGIDCGVYRWPGVYTEVTKFTNWIQGKIDHESQGLCPVVG